MKMEFDTMELFIMRAAVMQYADALLPPIEDFEREKCKVIIEKLNDRINKE